MQMSSSPVFERWKLDWSIGFTPSALSSAVTMQYSPIDRTFVRIEMQSREMMKAWFELMRQNHPRLVTQSQMSVLMAGPCKFYMCYLTTNHADIRDPLAVSCVAPMYVNRSIICFQGLMELNKTHIGTLNNTSEPLILLNLSSKLAPRNEAMPFELIFISPTTKVGKGLRSLLDEKDVNYNRCIGGTLLSSSAVHEQGNCTCSLAVGGWREVGIIKEFQTDKLMVVLPRISFKGANLGSINLPLVTGRSFNVIKQDGWTDEDEGVAILTLHWLQYSDFLRSKAEKASFLFILVGVDGIHTIDFGKFITIDPFESLQQTDVSSTDQGSGSGILRP